MRASILVNIFNGAGQIVREVRELVPPSSKHDHYVIDSILHVYSDR